MWAVANLIGPVLSLLSRPVGRYILLGMVFVAWGAYQRVDATEDCKERELRAQLEEQNRQLVAARKIAEQARLRAESSRREMAELRGIADGLVREIEEKGSGCFIDDNTREWLLKIK